MGSRSQNDTQNENLAFVRLVKDQIATSARKSFAARIAYVDSRPVQEKNGASWRTISEPAHIFDGAD
ncbi:MAG: hypothetical protein DMG70_00720 [Acidobacteria bacterium]|nr:MAG: hypothetical protein DMG70_00720 [Acidobacteriota bacterium]